MYSSGNARDPLQQVDYPKGGIESPDWIKVTPGDPSAWDAFIFSWDAFIFSGEDGYKSYFLGSGETNLEANIALDTM